MRSPVVAWIRARAHQRRRRDGRAGPDHATIAVRRTIRLLRQRTFRLPLPLVRVCSARAELEIAMKGNWRPQEVDQGTAADVLSKLARGRAPTR